MGLKGKQVLIAADQLLNTLICGGYADETMSSHCWRMAEAGKPRALYWRPKIDWVFEKVFRDGPNHCFHSYESERMRRHSPPEFQTV